MQLPDANAPRDVESRIGWNYTVFVERFEASGFMRQRPLLRMYIGMHNHPAKTTGYFAIPGGEYG